MSLVNNLQFAPLLLFLRFSQVPNPPSHTNQTYFTLLYKINAQANTLRTLLCQERDRARERGEEERKKLDTILRAVGFFVVSFCKPKRRRSERCRRRWSWRAMSGRRVERKAKHMKGTFFFVFFYIYYFYVEQNTLRNLISATNYI